MPIVVKYALTAREMLANEWILVARNITLYHRLYEQTAPPPRSLADKRQGAIIPNGFPGEFLFFSSAQIFR
jgi:hypothetical protein